MRNDLRVVLDTNVLVSGALLPHSVPRQAYVRATRSGVLLVSEDVFEELTEVMRRPRFDRYLSEEERIEFLGGFLLQAQLVDVPHRIQASRDLKDNRFLELAVSGNATHVVSGDKDLLVLHAFQGIPVLTPQEFLRVTEGEVS